MHHITNKSISSSKIEKMIEDTAKEWKNMHLTYEFQPSKHH
jgi:hypothetical protein